MAIRKVTVTLSNQTGEDLSVQSANLTEGVWLIEPKTPRRAPAAAEAPPGASPEEQAKYKELAAAAPKDDGPPPPLGCACKAAGEGSGVAGQVTYSGASGSITITWNNPASGSNTRDKGTTGRYDAPVFQGNEGNDLKILCSVRLKPEEQAPAPPPAPKPEEKAEDHTGQAHVAMKSKGPIVISPKRWLVDIAWQAANHLEWDTVILEVTENRHGLKPSDPAKGRTTCPGQLLDLTRYGVKKSGACDKDHEFFYSWCGDFVTWVFWKGFVLKEEAGETPKVDKKTLGTFLNREALNGKWVTEKNLSMVEDYARGSTSGKLLEWHTPGDGYAPQPGDIYMLDRADGGHIGIITSYDPTAKGTKPTYYEFQTLDGKSFDKSEKGWFHEYAQQEKRAKKDKEEPKPTNIGSSQGISQNARRTDQGEQVRSYIDASKLREALGYR